MHFFLSPSFFLFSLHPSALLPLACRALICHIYNGNIQIYRCYQLITSALITIQLTPVSTCHAAGHTPPHPLPPLSSSRSEREREGGVIGGGKMGKKSDLIEGNLEAKKHSI